MKHTCTFTRALWLFFGISMLVSCSDNMADYYKEPVWLKGSIYQVLEDRGDYSQFLKGIDLAGFSFEGCPFTFNVEKTFSLKSKNPHFKIKNQLGE